MTRSINIVSRWEQWPTSFYWPCSASVKWRPCAPRTAAVMTWISLSPALRPASKLCPILSTRGWGQLFTNTTISPQLMCLSGQFIRYCLYWPILFIRASFFQKIQVTHFTVTIVGSILIVYFIKNFQSNFLKHRYYSKSSLLGFSNLKPEKKSLLRSVAAGIEFSRSTGKEVT